MDRSDGARGLLAAAALTVVATAAHAAGVNLAWNDCGPGGAATRTFACNTNSGANALFMSVVAPTPMGQLNGHEGVIDLQTDQAELSDWWKIGVGGCRLGSTISANFDFIAGPFSCADVWVGKAAGACAGCGAGAFLHVGFGEVPLSVTWGDRPSTASNLVRGGGRQAVAVSALSAC